MTMIRLDAENAQMKQISTTPTTPMRESKVAQLIDRELTKLEGEKTVTQVADEAGFPQRNIMSMIRNGTTKLPFERLRGVAKALRVDLAYMVDLALHEYQPALESLLKEIHGEFLSSNEKKLLRLWRAATQNADPSVDLVEAELVGFIQSLPQLSPGQRPRAGRG
jgi:hypothetical protein